MRIVRIALDKILHFAGGVIGWLYFHFVWNMTEANSHVIILIVGGLWELYWRIKAKEKFDVIDWLFVVLGALAIHGVATCTWLWSPIGYTMCLIIYLNYRKTWRK